MTKNRGVAAAVGMIAFAPAILTRPAFAVDPIRIMPVGDSITAGYTDNPDWRVPFQFGYRSGLYERLTASQQQGGAAFQFVGNSPEPFNGAFGQPQIVGSPDLRTVGQNGHEGYGGEGTGFVSSNIQSWLATDQPNVVLLMIGINDIPAGSTAAPTSAELNLNNIVNTVVTDAPAAHLIVAQITPYTSYTPAISLYNTYISDTLVPSYAAQGKFVTTVNQYANFTDATGTVSNTQLYSNGYNHPNAAGYDRMAQTWFNGITSLSLGVDATPPTNLVTNGGFEMPVEGNNSHNIQPAGAGWAFTKSSVNGAGTGIDRGDPYGAGNSTPFDGSQQGFIQSSGDGSVSSISQVVAGFKVGHQYELSFHSKAIAGFQGADPFHVELIDGQTIIPLFAGNDLTPVTTDYLLYTDDFTATDSTLTLAFLDDGLTTYQKVSWIDGVSITEVPEPASLGLLAISGGALLIRRRGRREAGSLVRC